MTDNGEFSLPRPDLLVANEEQRLLLSAIHGGIAELEGEIQRIQRLLGPGRSTIDPDPRLPEIEALHRWSQFSGRMLDRYREDERQHMAEARRLYSDHVDVRGQIERLDAMFATAWWQLRLIHRDAVLRIHHIHRVHIVDRQVHNDLMESLNRYIERARELFSRLVQQVQQVAIDIDWVETVSRNKRLSPDDARERHASNVAAIRPPGDEQGVVFERLRAVGVVERALDDGRSVAIGINERDPTAVEWLARHLGEFNRARFLQLELPRAAQRAIGDFLDSDGTAQDQADFLDALRRNGRPDYGWANDRALIELIQTARRNGIPVVAGDTGVRTGNLFDRRATSVPYMAAVHRANADSFGGPGIIVTGRLHTNVVDGLESLIPGLVSLDATNPRLDGATRIEPGEAVLTPWNGRYTDLSGSASELRANDWLYVQGARGNDNSTVLFNPRPPQ